MTKDKLLSFWLSLPRILAPESVLLVLAVFSRLIPHAPNFTAVGAVALFAGYFFSSRRSAFTVSMTSMLLSDIVLGPHSTLVWVYAAFALTVLLGRRVTGAGRPGAFSWTSAALANITAALVFFVVTNFGVWASTPLYPHTWSGLASCFVAAIPFFWNTVSSQIFFGSLLFGIHRLIRRKNPLQATRLEGAMLK